MRRSYVMGIYLCPRGEWRQSAVATYNTGKDAFPKPADSARLCFCGSQCEKVEGVFGQSANSGSHNPRSADSFRTYVRTLICLV